MELYLLAEVPGLPAEGGRGARAVAAVELEEGAVERVEVELTVDHLRPGE